MPEPPNDNSPPTFEGSLAQLQQIVQDLEEGRLGLEMSLSRFEEGVRLLRSCYQILEQAEQRIEILAGQDAAGQLLTAPFDSTATFDGGEKQAKKPGRRRGAAKTEPPSDGSSPGGDSDDVNEGGLF